MATGSLLINLERIKVNLRECPNVDWYQATVDETTLASQKSILVSRGGRKPENTQEKARKDGSRTTPQDNYPPPPPPTNSKILKDLCFIRNQTKLWPAEKYCLESFVMSLPSPFWQLHLVLFCSLLIKSSATDLKCFWLFNCKKLPSVKPKLNSAIGVTVDWITVC